MDGVSSQSSQLHIVGIGASAGGVEALEQFFRPMPVDTQMAFVVITHLGLAHESILPEIIGRYTKMPVQAIEHDQKIEPQNIYVLPRNAIATVCDGMLCVRLPDPVNRERNPIDIFFASLAEVYGEDAIAIILSGGGSDGTLGIKAIKERGGLTLAQIADGTAPKVEAMPLSAIATGLVDFAIPVQQMPEKLVEYVRSSRTLDGLMDPSQTKAEQERLAAARLQICKIIRNQIGHDFSGYKEKTFMRRVQRRMHVLEITDLEAFTNRLQQDTQEVSNLFRDLLIGVTDFFRDAEAFKIIEDKIVPKLFEGKNANDTVRIWVPGCTTGEEVYSLAILIREYVTTLQTQPKVKIFATDIDEAALAVARIGKYPVQLLGSVSAERLSRFFTGDGTSYALVKEIRDLCVFSSHSVIRDPPFSRIDLISCRNLLIYLNHESQRQLIPVFHYALRPGGFLFLGTSESIAQHADLFAPLEKTHRIFQRRDNPASAPRFPLFVSHGRPHSADEPRRSDGKMPTLSNMRHAVESRVLDRFAPAHVVVNREGDIVYYSARTGKYIEPPSGSPSRQLVLMAKRGLRLEIRAALRQAMETGLPVVQERLPVELDDHVQLVTLRIEPLPDEDNSDPLFLVLFTDEGLPLTQAELAERTVSATSDNGVKELERELRDSRERLQSMVEEYETGLEELKSANEELVSVNEELQSTNEELETSKEEVQSINEELQTVNHELGIKLDELDRANVDLKNLFESTKIATVFLDRQMLVRSFTPEMVNIFNLITADRGRPITDIANNLEDVDFSRDVRAVLQGGPPYETQISRRDRRAHYLMQIVPYLNSEHAIDGALITFVEITPVVAAEERHRTLVDELNHRVRNMLQVVSGLAAQTVRRSPTLEAFSGSFLGRVQALAIAYELLSDEKWGNITLRDLILREIKPHAVGGDRVKTADLKILLTPKAALALSLIVHELTTNALKYGALSNARGYLEINWRHDPNGALVLSWHEKDGPEPVNTEKLGFGSELINRQARYELDGNLDVEFAPSGLQATITIPSDPHLFLLEEAV